MAPGAQLYLICIDTEVDLALAEQDAIADGVKIINHSVAWFNTSRGDGTGGAGHAGRDRRRRAGARDPLGQRGRQLRAATTGAARSRPTRRPDLNDFAPGDDPNAVTIEAGEQACAFLKWDDWPVTTRGLRPRPRPESDGTVVASLDERPGDGPGAPTEELCYTNTGPDRRPSDRDRALQRRERRPGSTCSTPGRSTLQFRTPPGASPSRRRRPRRSPSAPSAGRPARLEPTARRGRRSTAARSPTSSRPTASRP